MQLIADSLNLVTLFDDSSVLASVLAEVKIIPSTIVIENSDFSTRYKVSTVSRLLATMASIGSI